MDVFDLHVELSSGGMGFVKHGMTEIPEIGSSLSHMGTTYIVIERRTNPLEIPWVKVNPKALDSDSES